MSRGLRQFAVGAFALALASPALSQATGTITGRVTERQTQRPLVGAQVRIVGSTRGAITNDSGTYRIINVPAATV
ncbi:MAG TPA: carboxypeptidase-like regulatory domain-containing protein, partial [Gemmatimonadaceae bacterium]|nr:carboxypeptidase-like regulatory domain-containing protein [Gemmatimonadaceae bacterium]